jgi:hypothetical protein
MDLPHEIILDDSVRNSRGAKLSRNLPPDRRLADTGPSPDEQKAAHFRASVVDLIDVALEEIVWARLGLA